MKLFDLKNAGHWPTLLAAFLYFDFSFMVWTVLGPLGAQIGEKLNLSPEQKGLMVALPILVGAVLRILLGLLVDRVGAKNAGIMAQLVVITGLALALIFWTAQLPGDAANGPRARRLCNSKPKVLWRRIAGIDRCSTSIMFANRITGP
jgi:nitrate/nitrite transporter NarK